MYVHSDNMTYRGALAGRIRSGRGPAQPVAATAGTLAGLFDQVEAQGATQTSVVRNREETTDAGIAQRLRLPARARLVHIERLVWSPGAPVEWRRSLVRGDRHSFVVELSPTRLKQPALPWAYESSP